MMKTTIRTALAVLLLMASSVAYGQQAQNNPVQDLQPGDTIRVRPASDIVGRVLTDSNGTDAGRINSLIINMSNGSVEYVLIGEDQNFDLNGRLVAFPWSLLDFRPGSNRIEIGVSADELRRAPRIESGLVYRLLSPTWRNRVYGYWGYPGNGYYGYYGHYGAPYPYDGYAVAAPYGPRTTAANRENAPNSEAGPNGQAVVNNGNGPSNAPQQNSASTSTPAQHSAGNTADRGDGQVAEPANGLAVDQSGVVAALTSQATTSEAALRSATVHAKNGDLLGRIDQVLIDTGAGKVAYVLIERGGFLGLNPAWFAVPVEALTWSRYQPDSYRLTVDEQVLRNLPTIPVNEQLLPRSVPVRDLAKLYDDFGIAPYWQDSGQSNQAGQASQADQQSTTGRARQ